VEQAKCYHQKGALPNEVAWFKATFKNTSIVASFDIFNMEINDPANEVTSSLIQGASVFVDDKLCAVLPKNITKGQVVNIHCSNPNVTQNRLAKD
jgi:hypothetical protein